MPRLHRCSFTSKESCHFIFILEVTGFCFATRQCKEEAIAAFRARLEMSGNIYMWPNLTRTRAICSAFISLHSRREHPTSSVPLDMIVPSLTDSGLQITEVTVEIATASSKWIQSMDIKIDNVNVKGRVKQRRGPGTARDLTVVLDRPTVIVLSLRVTAHLRYNNLLKECWRSPEITIDAQDLECALSYGASEKREWHSTFGKLSIIVGLMRREILPQIEPTFNDAPRSARNEYLDYEEHILTPTIESILRDCPWFRILVIGNMGVGKSKLINKAFGVNHAIVSDTERGHADIDKEIYSVEDCHYTMASDSERRQPHIDEEIRSAENSHFILHDSKGFEAGDDANVTIVQNFITKRNEMPLIKDKLHAIWLCVDIPLAGARFLEKGVKQFLRLKMEDKLGPVPVIVVFTKYDRLALNVHRQLKADELRGKSKEEINMLIEQKADAALKQLCWEPFDKLVKKKVPHVTISVEDGYEARLSDLIHVTYERVRDQLADASVVTAMAQRINPRVKLMASIEIGRRKYWERLATSIYFSGRQLQQCLDVLHTDIIKVWQFPDAHDHLSSPSFKALVSNIVTAERGMMQVKGDPRKNFVAGVSFVAGIAGIIAALAGPAAPIVIPIAASFVLAKWVYDMYTQTTVVLKFLMTYIIDLTLVLQNVYWLQHIAGGGKPLSRRIIKAGARAYFESNTKETITFKIDKHIKGVTFDLGPDATLNMIVELIESCLINPADILEERVGFVALKNNGDDEPWEA